MCSMFKRRHKNIDALLCTKYLGGYHEKSLNYCLQEEKLGSWGQGWREICTFVPLTFFTAAFKKYECDAPVQKEIIFIILSINGNMVLTRIPRRFREEAPGRDRGCAPDWRTHTFSPKLSSEGVACLHPCPQTPLETSHGSKVCATSAPGLGCKLQRPADRCDQPSSS